jgi:hypothetical protein
MLVSLVEVALPSPFIIAALIVASVTVFGTVPFALPQKRDRPLTQ